MYIYTHVILINSLERQSIDWLQLIITGVCNVGFEHILYIFRVCKNYTPPSEGRILLIPVKAFHDACMPSNRLRKVGSACIVTKFSVNSCFSRRRHTMFSKQMDSRLHERVRCDATRLKIFWCIKHFRACFHSAI